MVREPRAVEPYGSSLEHLLAELARADLLVRAQLVRARRAAGGEDDAFRGLSISDEEVDALLARQPGAPRWTALPAVPELAEAEAGLLGEIEARVAASRAHGVTLRLDALATRFGLDRFDLDLFLIGLLPELDTRYERLYAYLQDDVTRRRPSVDLALSLLCPSWEARLAARARVEPRSALLRHALVRLFSDAPQLQPPLISHFYKVEERIVAWLHGSDEPDAPWARLVAPAIDLSDLLLPAPLAAQLDGLLRARPPIYLQGPYGAGKKSIAEALCRRLGKNLLIADVEPLALSTEAAAEAPRLIAREARLAGAIIYWDHVDALFADERRPALAAFLRALAEAGGEPAIFGGEAAWDPPAALGGIRLTLALPDAADQARLWQRALAAGDPAPAEGVNPALLAARYQLTGGRIRDAAATARGLARLRSLAQVTLDELTEACRRHSQPRLGTVARKVATGHGWDDLVLPPDRIERLGEICARARQRARVLQTWGFDAKLSTGKGLSVLFSGAPGTGKTLAASVLANELGLELYQIDLSAVVSKYIGETEKQLARIFAEAEHSRAILFFDEADALFGKRSEVQDAHDRYANIETSYLLQRMEAFDGVAILASNFSRNLDEAFIRRLSYVIEFPLPDEPERRRIWERIWPDGVPRAGDLDLAMLARRFELTGAHIRNIALAAAFLAAEEGSSVEQRHVLHAARREYQKMGKMTDDALFARTR